jgi:phosphoribosylamine--glycine ligase
MKKNILVVGGGGREHAVVKAIKKSKDIGTIFVAPGNGGISLDAKIVDIKATDIDGLVDFAQKNELYMTVVTPDDPLSLGLVDRLSELGLRAFGPTKAAAEIESSKVFSKNLMQKYGIPTAQYAVLTDFESGLEYIQKAKYPLVLKADGLALGKGVFICESKAEAEESLRSLMLEKKFGGSGNQVIAEEFLSGKEVSLLAFCDGKTAKLMPPSCDYKRAYDGDKGANTGGMGAYCPTTWFDKKLQEKAMERVVLPTLAALCNEGRPFKGVLYSGLMVKSDDIKVLEFNARFGDPETQVILPSLQTDLLDVFDACIDGTLDKKELNWDEKARVLVVLASRGYPLSAEKGKEITFAKSINEKNSFVFHAGTRWENGRFFSAGGRVINAVGEGEALVEARENAYERANSISFDGMFFRKDIANSL